MLLLRREKRSWNGEDDEIVDTKNKKKNNGVLMTKERMRLLDEERNGQARLARLEVVLIKYRIGKYWLVS